MGFFYRLFVGKSAELGLIRARKFLMGWFKATALLAVRCGELKFALK